MVKRFWLRRGSNEVYSFNVENGKAKRLKTADGNCHNFLASGSIVGALKDADNKSSIVKIYNNLDVKELANFKTTFKVLKLIPFPKSNKCILMGSEEYAVLNGDSKKD